MRRTVPALIACTLIALSYGVLVNASTASDLTSGVLALLHRSAPRGWEVSADLRQLPAVFRSMLPSSPAAFSAEAAQEPVGPPVVSTDRTGYFRGATVAISGLGFAADERITLQVTHRNGGAETGAGHDAFEAWSDADGNFTASWELGDDTAGHDFQLTVAGATTGTVPPVAFSRIAAVETNKYDFQPGETALITGEGFQPAEVVMIQVQHSNGNNDGAGHSPFAAVAGEDGRIATTWFVHPDDSEESIFRLTARGNDSHLLATSTFTDLLVTLIDDEGPDDEPGQKDLSQMSSNPGASAVAITWNWDDTDFGNLGGNTGDACSLVDTDADGKANYSFCVVADGNPASQIANRLYRCDADSRSDRCAGPTQVLTFTSTSSASVVPNSDPFRTHPAHTDGNDCDNDADCLTDDTVANVTLQLADVGGAGVAKLLNVCSYPSQEPNSDPSDCVVTPDSGFLTIVKTTDVTTSTAFVFTSSAPSQNGTSSWTINGSGSTQQFSFAPATTYDLTETVPNGWDLTSASCDIQTSPVTPTGTQAQSGGAVTGVDNFEIRSGLETVCTFNDTRDLAEEFGQIIVDKVTVPSGDSQLFTFTPSYNGAATFDLADATPPNDTGYTLAPGTYSVAETVPAGWDLTSSTCTSTQAGDASTPAAIALDAGETVTCTFTNTKRGHIIVDKVTLPGGDPQSFNFDASGGSYADFSLTDAATPNNQELVPGAYSVSETVPAGWDLTSACTSSLGDTETRGAIELDAGETVTCTFTNRKRGMATLHKLTNGLESSTAIWNFTLKGGTAPNLVNESDSTPPAAVDFGGVKLIPGVVYTMCETGIPAGWTLEWKVDTNGDGTPETTIPFFAGGNSPPAGWTGYSNVYDPYYVAPPGQYTNDTRCVQFTVQPGQTLAFEINNSFPGGDPRTIGYWKNWNTCSGGRQDVTAAKNGGPAAGWFILNDLLNNPGYFLGKIDGSGLKLDGDSTNALTTGYISGDCVAAVRILDKSNVKTGKKSASDGAYNMAAQLLAALLNLSAGAETCSAVTTAVTNAQALLVLIDFNGTTDSYLKNGANFALSNSLASTLDRYNNGNLCTP